MIKKYGIGMAAVLIAISAAAFTNSNTHKPNAMKWFVLNSGATALGTNTSYSLAPSNGANPNCPTRPNTVCAVEADPDGTNSNIPDQSQLTAIKTASSDFTISADHLEYVQQ